MASRKQVVYIILGLLAACQLVLVFHFHFKAKAKNNCSGLDCAGIYNDTDVDNKYDIIIIGSGPTALGAAQRIHELKREFPNISIVILEQTEKPGGLASSERDDQGFLWDMGGHVVFSHYEYFDWTLDRAVKEWNQKQRAAYAFMKGSDDKRRFIPYPVQSNIEVMDKVDQQKSLSGLKEIAANPVKEKPSNFDQWLLRNFGTGLCDVFMRKYNRKVWTVDPTEMNSVWVGERVAVPDIAKIKAKIAAYDKGTPAKDSAWGPNNVFRFPKYRGTGGIWQAVADLLPSEWFKFHHKVTGINIDKKSVMVEIGRGEKSVQEFKFDSLISTVPLDIFVNMINGRGESLEEMKKLTSQLVYSHTHVIGIGLTGQPPPTLASKSWMYFPDSDSPFYRITVFSSYSDDHVPKPGKQWSLMCEAAEPKSNSNPEKWTNSHLIGATIHALINYGFIKSETVVSQYYRRLDRGYPVPSINREMILKKVQPWLESKGIYSRGRFGGWRYEVANQDHSFMQGVEISDRLLKGVPEETYFDANLVNSRRNTGRFLGKPLSDYEIVIAHYNEKLDWVAPIANHSRIYHKGTDIQPPTLHVKAWERLPNVGRESHTYLYHIINNYEKLPEVTVFVQGEGLSRFCFDSFKNILYNIQNNVACKVFDRNNDWGKIRHIEKWLEELNSGKMRPSNLTVGEFYQELFGFSHPETVPLCYAGCFAATRNMIRKHSIEFYKKAISFVDDHINPEEGHYFERLWATIFS